jgi:hypothetical protein
MWTDVAIAEKDIADITPYSVPSSFRLGDDGELRLDGPLHVVQGTGAARITCRATIRWSLLGIQAPMVLPRVTLHVRREIISTDEGRRVALSVRVEELPHPIERGATLLVNHELESQRVALTSDASAAMRHDVVAARPRPPVVILPAQPDVRHAA